MKEKTEVLTLEELKDLINAADDRTVITVHFMGDKTNEEENRQQGSS